MKKLIIALLLAVSIHATAGPCRKVQYYAVPMNVTYPSAVSGSSLFYLTMSADVKVTISLPASCTTTAKYFFSHLTYVGSTSATITAMSLSPGASRTLDAGYMLPYLHIYNPTANTALLPQVVIENCW